MTIAVADSDENLAVPVDAGTAALLVPAYSSVADF